MQRLNPIIAWTFIVFGCLLLLAGVNQCYIDLVEHPSKQWSFISCLVFGAGFLAVGMRIKKKNIW
jgi:uncharacterized membrane protein HdeD (DUF308 family)